MDGGFLNFSSIFSAYTSRTLTIKVVFFFSLLFRQTLVHFRFNTFLCSSDSSSSLFSQLLLSLFRVPLFMFSKRLPFPIYIRCSLQIIHWCKRLKPAEEGGVKLPVAAVLLFNVNENATGIDTATLCGRGDEARGTPQRHLGNHSLAHGNGRDVSAFATAVIKEEIMPHLYPKTSHAIEKCCPGCRCVLYKEYP